MAEDAEAAGEKWLLRTVALHMLLLEERDQRLGHREAGHVFFLSLRGLADIADGDRATGLPRARGGQCDFERGQRVSTAN